MTTRTQREIRADLDAVNDEIGAYWTLSGPQRYRCRGECGALEAKRRRLEAELAEARAIEAQTPDMFAEAGQ